MLLVYRWAASSWDVEDTTAVTEQPDTVLLARLGMEAITFTGGLTEKERERWRERLVETYIETSSCLKTPVIQGTVCVCVCVCVR